MTAGTVAGAEDISILHRALIPSGTSKALPSYGLPKYTSDIPETRLKGIKSLGKTNSSGCADSVGRLRFACPWRAKINRARRARSCFYHSKLL